VAAAYLGLSVASVKYHVHTAGDLHGIKVGPALAFTQEELDRFQAEKRPAGRPRKES
jgi:hypothetical protein